MDNNNPVRYSDLISPDDSVEKLVKQLDELSSSLQFVQKSAVTLKESMVTTSGATDSGREAIAKASKEADKLAKAQAELAFAQSEAGRKLAEYKAQIADVNAENKRLAKTVDAAAGSYDDLSATYSRLKAELNKMAPKTKEEVETFAEMQKRAAEVRAEMDRLQKATGNYSISVGNYKEGTQELIGVQKSMRSELKDVKEELARLNLAGETTSSRYKELVARAGEITDAMGDASQAARMSASDTSNLDAVLGGATAVTGGFAVATSMMSILGANTEDVEKAQRKLQEAIALVNGVQSIANALNKDSALRVKLLAISQKLLAKTTSEAATATNGATLATKGFRAAIISTGIGALVAALGFAVSKFIEYRDKSEAAANASERMKEQAEKDAVELTKSYENLAEARKNYTNVVREHNEAEGGTSVVIKNLNDDMEKQKQILEDAQDEIIGYQGGLKYLNKEHGELVWLIEHAKKKGYDDLEKSLKAELATNEWKLKSTSTRLKNTEALEANTKANIIKIGDDLKAAQAKQEEAAAKKKEEAEKAEEKARQEEEKREQNRVSAKIEINSKIRANEKASLDAMKDDQSAYYAEQTKLLGKWSQEDFDAEKQRYDKQLAEMEKSGLTKEQIESLHKANMLNINLQYLSELQNADDQYNAWLDSEEKKNAQKLEEKSLKDLETQRANTELEIEQMKGSEKKKAKLRLQAELDYQEARLKLAKQGVIGMSEAEISQLKIQILTLRKDLSQETQADSIWDLMGFSFSSEKQQALDSAINTAMDNVKSLTQSFVDLKTSALESAKARTEAAKTALDAEIEAREKGLANNIDTAQKEYANAKRNQEKALAEQKKAQRAQALLDSATQASSLITASAEIWKAWAKVPPVAIAAIATMWGSFGAAKIKAAQVTKSEKYGEGTVELLNGGSHQSGNDIDLGTKKDGTRRRAEGGEYFAVINRRSSRKYKSVIPNVIKALNDGTFEAKNLNANARIGGVNISVGDIGKTADLRNVEKGINNIYEQSKSRIFVDAKGNTVIQSNGYTQVIKR